MTSDGGHSATRKKRWSPFRPGKWTARDYLDLAVAGTLLVLLFPLLLFGMFLALAEILSKPRGTPSPESGGTP